MRALIFLLLFSVLTSAQAQTTSSETEAALEKLNTSFRNQYGLARTEYLDSVPLVIVIDIGKVTWISHGKRQEMAVPLVSYTETKTLLHSILGVYGVGSQIVHENSGQGDDAVWKSARELQGNLDQAIQLTAKTELDAEDQARLHSILGRLRDSVAGWIARGSLSQQELDQSLRPIRVDAMVLVDKTGLLQFQNLRTCLETIRQGVPVADWNHALVVALGSAAARNDNVGVAAAISEFGRPALGHRIFYAENIFDADGALHLLAGLQIDSALSESFFGNPYRMWQDVLDDEVNPKVGGDFYPGLAQ